MRRILLLSLLCLGLFQQAEAQILIKGKVTDAESPDMGLPGATISIKGTTQGTTTDTEGAYSLQVPSKATVLVFSYIGMQNQEVIVGEQTVINVVLKSDATQLTEVVVVGYGTQKRKDLTSAVSKIDGKELADVPAAYSFDGAMQGKTAGVNISTPSGTPGAAINVNIRGTTSIGASSQPLYVIDGVPIVARNNSALNSNIQPMNPLAEINPNDIESITVLKDASASAIYGSRGANGVIIITTKRGKAGKPKFSLGYYTGVSEISNTPELMDSRQWIEFYNAAAEFDGLGENYFNSSLGDPTEASLPNYNAYDHIFKTGVTHNVDVSVQGGNENSKYFLSANYFNQDGIQKGLGFERISGRLNLDNSLSDRIGIGTNITISRTNHNRTINENDEYGVVINAQAWDPTAPLTNEDGTYTNPFSYNGWWALENPLLIAEQYVNTGKTTRVLGSIYGTYDFSDKLTFKTTWSLDYNSLVEESFIPAGFNQTAIGEGVYATYDETAWIGESTLSYNEELGDHSISALVGHTLQESISNFSDITGQGFASNNNPPVSTAATTVGTSSMTSFGFQSFFSRFNYGFKGKYLVSLSLRADGSSRFGRNNRYGVFPAMSLGWRVSDESFMKFAEPVVSNLKFRASYGVTGNAEIGNFTYRNGFALSSSYNNTPGIAPSSLGNPNLTWEQTAQLDIGLDLGLFKDRVTIVADYFVKNTTDILLARDIPGTLGFGSITDNFGEIENRGVELGINADIIKTKKGFTWNANFNYTHVKNEVINVLNNGQIISRNFVILEGQELSQLNLIRFLGVDPLTGDAKFEDLNGDGLINLADRQAVGSGLPTDFAGLTNTFSYKGFSLAVFFQFSGGNKIFNQSRYAYENYGSLQDGIPFGNQSVRSLNYWKEPGDITDIPRPSLVTANDTDAQYQRFSTQYLEDGDFLRLKNVKLSYSVPSQITEKLNLSSLRLYVQGRNLKTWTNYTGFDPEVSTNTSSQGDLNAQQGEDFGTLGQARTYTFGINIGF